jgi:hypothetical protein
VTAARSDGGASIQRRQRLDPTAAARIDIDEVVHLDPTATLDPVPGLLDSVEDPGGSQLLLAG